MLAFVQRNDQGDAGNRLAIEHAGCQQLLAGLRQAPAVLATQIPGTFRQENGQGQCVFDGPDEIGVAEVTGMALHDVIIPQVSDACLTMSGTAYCVSRPRLLGRQAPPSCTRFTAEGLDARDSVARDSIVGCSQNFKKNSIP
jgi:hypothetical protein